jgi:hypothetical protein
MEKHPRPRRLRRTDDPRPFIDPAPIPLDIGLEENSGAVIGHRRNDQLDRSEKPLTPHGQRQADFGNIGQRGHRASSCDATARLHPRDRISTMHFAMR